MKLSAVRSVFGPWLGLATCLLWLLLTSTWAQAAPCVPSPEIRIQLEKITVVVAKPADLDRGLAPLLALRQKYPQDLAINQRYQDAVQQYGIEGHLRKLTEEYQVLSMQHPDDPMYGYLYARSLMGRNTSAAIQQMMEIVASHPGFAPAHGSLAEMFGASIFRDDAKEKIERERFLALCPGSKLQQRPARLPDPSPLIDQAERSLSQHEEPNRVAAMADQGIREDEWRLQRIRPFDWYSVDYKHQVQRELQARYWRVWSIQVRCHRLAGRAEQATELLAVMEQRAAALHKNADPLYWDALAALAHLYEEGKQKDLAVQKLNSMQEFLAAHPDPGRAARLEELRKLTP